MTDQKPQPTADELERDEAKLALQTPPEPIAAAAGLPDDVRTGNPDADPGEDDPDIGHEAPTTDG